MCMFFQTTGDKWMDVGFDEFYCHTNRTQKNKAAQFAHWHKLD